MFDAVPGQYDQLVDQPVQDAVQPQPLQLVAAFADAVGQVRAQQFCGVRAQGLLVRPGQGEEVVPEEVEQVAAQMPVVDQVAVPAGPGVPDGDLDPGGDPAQPVARPRGVGDVAGVGAGDQEVVVAVGEHRDPPRPEVRLQHERSVAVDRQLLTEPQPLLADQVAAEELRRGQ